jgi:uncharacterized protein YndB with AHSA1/START domain
VPTDSIVLSRILPTTPARVFAAWIDAAEHAAMTGSPATVEAAEVGGRFSAWDGYIDGSFVALEPDTRIVASWRSDDFPADALDSLLEVLLEPAPGGTRVTLRHGDLPEGQGPALLEGWDEFYLAPMERYFARGARRGAKGRGKAAKAAAKPRRAGKKKAAKGSSRRKAAPRQAGRKPARKTAKVSKKKGAGRG